MNEICAICGKEHDLKSCELLQIVEYVPDRKVPSRARLTMPEFLQLQILSDGSYSVSTKQAIKRGTEFGPYQARKVTEDQASCDFPLKIFDDQDPKCCLDTCDENKCNWLYFVGIAGHTDEQNLMCYQKEKNIYYVTIKDINVNETLRVWYAPYYAKKLNKILPGAAVEEEDMSVEDPLKNIDINTLIKEQQKIVERTVWTCKICGQTETVLSVYAKHIIKHYKTQLRKTCETCGVMFGTKTALKNHQKIVHGSEADAQKPRKMPEVSVKVSSVGGPLLNDLFTDSSDLQFTVSIDSENLLLDTDNLSVDNLLSENVKNLDHFNFEIDDNQKQFVCDICLKQFNKVRLLVMHLKHHTGEYTCYKCLKIFCRNENLRAHTCNLQVLHKCDKCFKTFTQKKYLLRHTLAIHDKKFKCVNCNRIYHSNRELSEHNCSQLSINDKQLFSCPICDKVFLRNLYRKKHMKTHLTGTESGDSVICEVCGKAYGNLHVYKVHLKSHNDSVPKHTCNICDKRFHRSDSLSDHILRHLQPQLECKECHKQLGSKRQLRTHMKKHVSEHKFRCTHCNMTFKLADYLNKHIKKHHTPKPLFKIEDTMKVYSCPLCENKTMKLRSSLIRHIRKCHPNVNPSDYHSQISAQKAVVEKSASFTLSEEVNKELDAHINNILNDTNIEKEAVNSLVEELDLNIKSNLSKMEKANAENNNAPTSESREVLLSIPDLTENDQEITLDKNAYILENGTIVQPQGDSDNVIIYVLDQVFP